MAKNNAALVKVGILRNDRELVFLRVSPNRFVTGALHAKQTNVSGAGIDCFERRNQAIRKILIEE